MSVGQQDRELRKLIAHLDGFLLMLNVKVIIGHNTILDEERIDFGRRKCWLSLYSASEYFTIGE